MKKFFTSLLALLVTVSTAFAQGYPSIPFTPVQDTLYQYGHPSSRDLALNISGLTGVANLHAYVLGFSSARCRNALTELPLAVRSTGIQYTPSSTDPDLPEGRYDIVVIRESSGGGPGGGFGGGSPDVVEGVCVKAVYYKRFTAYPPPSGTISVTTLEQGQTDTISITALRNFQSFTLDFDLLGEFFGTSYSQNWIALTDSNKALVSVTVPATLPPGQYRWRIASQGASCYTGIVNVVASGSPVRPSSFLGVSLYGRAASDSCRQQNRTNSQDYGAILQISNGDTVQYEFVPQKSYVDLLYSYPLNQYTVRYVRGAGGFKARSCAPVAHVDLRTGSGRNIYFSDSVLQDAEVLVTTEAPVAGEVFRVLVRARVTVATPAAFNSSCIVLELDSGIRAVPTPTELTKIDSIAHGKVYFKRYPSGSDYSYYISLKPDTTLLPGAILPLRAYWNLRGTTRADDYLANDTLGHPVTLLSEKPAASLSVFPSQTADPQPHTLRYTVHYTNTSGNKVYSVIIRDTLSPLLDVGSLRSIAFTHAGWLKLLPGRVLEYRIDALAVGVTGAFSFSIDPATPFNPSVPITNRATVNFNFADVRLTEQVQSGYQLVSTLGSTLGSKEQVQMVPNPTTGMVAFRLPKGVSGGLYAISATGAVVPVLYTISEGHVQADLHGLAPGLYLLRMGSRALGRVVVAR